MTAAVVVCVDRSASGRRALRWAAVESLRREAPLQVMVADRPRGSEHCSMFAATLAAIRNAVPDLRVLRHPAHDAVAGALRELSADAGAVVVPASLPGIEDVVADSYCPVFAIPDDTRRRPGTVRSCWAWRDGPERRSSTWPSARRLYAVHR